MKKAIILLCTLLFFSTSSFAQETQTPVSIAEATDATTRVNQQIHQAEKKQTIGVYTLALDMESKATLQKNQEDIELRLDKLDKMGTQLNDHPELVQLKARLEKEKKAIKKKLKNEQE